MPDKFGGSVISNIKNEIFIKTEKDGSYELGSSKCHDF